MFDQPIDFSIEWVYLIDMIETHNTPKEDEMMRASKYQIRRLATLLRTGDAWIDGQSTGGNQWPDYPHYWVVQDSTRQETYHVDVDDRPSWGRYNR